MASRYPMDQEEHPGVPQRPPASANFLIDSLDRYQYQYAELQRSSALDQPGNEFSIRSVAPALYGYFTRLAITQVYLKYDVPTVMAQDLSNNVPGNNVFSIQEAGGPPVFTLTIPQGYYTASSLIAAINVIFAAGAAPYNAYTASWNNLTNSIQISSNTANTFFVSPTIFNSNASVATNRVLRCKYLLGISQSNIGPAAAAAVQVFGPPRLYYTAFVDIQSDRLTKYQRVKDSESAPGVGGASNFAGLPPINSIVARVYLLAPNTRLQDISGGPAPGSAPVDVLVDYNTPKHIRWSPNEAVYELDFRLFDQFGQPLPWSQKNATEFYLTCVASET